MFARHDLPPMVSAQVHRDPVPVYKDGAAGRPRDKRDLGSDDQEWWGSAPCPRLAEPGTRVSVEWSVEGERGKVAATVVPCRSWSCEQARVDEPRARRGRTVWDDSTTDGFPTCARAARARGRSPRLRARGDRSLIAGSVGGLLVLGACLFAIRVRVPEDPGRRRFLALMGGLGLVAVAAGGAAGAVVRRLTRPDPRPSLEAMASDLGSEYLELVTRSYNAERSATFGYWSRPTRARTIRRNRCRSRRTTRARATRSPGCTASASRSWSGRRAASSRRTTRSASRSRISPHDHG